MPVLRHFRLPSALLALGLFAALPGCTDEQQLEDAREDLTEERGETAEEVIDAREDGIVTGDEAGEVREEVGEDYGAAGEVAEQKGELIESELDD